VVCLLNQAQLARLRAAATAWICFEDEVGQNLRPPKARTRAPRGHTAVVRVSGKGSGRVSVAGLVCLKPGARGHLFDRTRIHAGEKANAIAVGPAFQSPWLQCELSIGSMAPGNSGPQPRASQ